MRLLKFALQRKTGYISPYSLGSVYPSYRQGLAIQGSKGEWVAPIMMQVPFGDRRWLKVWPPIVRFPSWIARKKQEIL